MEDLDLSQRIKRRGRYVLVRSPLVTSGRRFLERGPWRTFFFIAWLLFLHTLRRDTPRIGLWLDTSDLTVAETVDAILAGAAPALVA